MKFLKWQLGRQKSGYEILPIIFWNKLCFDCYLIKISQGTEVPAHKDEVSDKRHVRLNIHIGSYTGGKFLIEDPIIKIFQFFWVIRPDKYEHKLELVKTGNLYIFSIGWTLKIIK